MYPTYVVHQFLFQLGDSTAVRTNALLLAFGFASQDILAACEVNEKGVEAINDTKDWDQGSMRAVLQRFRLWHTSTAKELWMQLKREIAAGLREPRTVPLKMPPNTLIYKPCLTGAKASSIGNCWDFDCNRWS